MKLSSGNISGKIIKALSVFSGVQAVGILCSIVRTKFIAVCMGELGVGLFAIFNSVIELVSTATQLNLRESAVRDISSAPSSRLSHIAAAVRWWAKRLGALGASVMLLFSPLLSYISFGDFSYTWAFALLSLAVGALAYTNAENAIMQGSDNLNALAKSVTIAAVVGTAISVPMFYLWGIPSVVPSILIVGAVGAFMAHLYSRTPSAANTKADNIAAGKGFLKLGMYLTVSVVASTAASYAFLSYLNLTTSTEEVGLYQAGYSLVIRYVGIIFSALLMEFYPRVVKVAMRPRMTSVVLSHEVVIVLYVLTPLLVMFVMLDDILVDLLYKRSFQVMLPFVTIGVGGSIFRAISYCMAYVIISRGDGRTYIVTEVASSIIGLGLNITMFHFWSFAGLGFSYVLWYFIYTFIVGSVYYFRYGMRLSKGCLWLIAISSIIVAASVILKPYGILPEIALLTVALALCYYGYTILFNKKIAG